MYKFITTLALIALFQSTGIIADAGVQPPPTAPVPPPTVPSTPAPAPSQNNTTPPPPPASQGNGTNNTLPQPKVISLNCNQAFMPLQDDNATASVNITECACKAFETPNGAFCEAESCSNFAVCQTCNQITPGPTPNSTITSNVTVPSVDCRNNYFLPAPTDTDKRALCTDVENRSFTCTGTCKGGASCGLCISMDDPALTSAAPDQTA